jgi:predicted ArsR family transcriptional regulator
MARRLGVTAMAVRQHLAVLQEEKVVDYVDERRKVGRPARVWRLTPKAGERFADRHVEVAVGMLQAVHSAFGDEGLERVIAERTRQQLEIYHARMPGPGTPLEQRVAALVKIRRDEGYMAEWRRVRDGSIELVENHCAIEGAARFCQKLCGAELSLFRTALGGEVFVDRFEYILGGDRRCAYRITEQAERKGVEPKLASGTESPRNSGA